MTETVLGTVLIAWMQRQRLNPTQLAEFSGLSRRTVYNVRDEGRASIETLWRLATGLATDPYTKAEDDLVYAEAFPDLLEAGGYPRDIARVIRVDVVDEITRRVRDEEKARQIIAYLESYPSRPMAERDAFDRLIEVKNEE